MGAKIGLDLAAGIGRCQEFLKEVCKETYYNDNDSDLMEQRFYPGIDKQYRVVCDVNAVFENITEVSFDLVLMNWALCFVTNPPSFLAIMFGRLAPGAIVYYKDNVKTPKTLKRKPGPEHGTFHKKNEVETWFKEAGFEQIMPLVGMKTWPEEMTVHGAYRKPLLI